LTLYRYGRVVVLSAAAHVYTLPEGEQVRGVASLAGNIYLLRWKDLNQVEVYDVGTFQLMRRLTVPDRAKSSLLTDMASCEYALCVYISDRNGECIYVFDVQALNFTQWGVGDIPNGLSVNASHNVLVTCGRNVIKEFGSRGELIRRVPLPSDVIHPWQTIQSLNNGYVVCHGDFGDAVNRVCKISADDRHIVHSHGSGPGPGSGQCHVPVRLALDNNEFAFAADFKNRRVKLLSPTLGHVRDVVSRDQLKWYPTRLCLDVQRGRLYVADNEWGAGMGGLVSGRVVVFSVH